MANSETPSAARMFEMKVRVLPSHYDWLTKRSEEDGVSRATILRECIDGAIEDDQTAKRKS